MQPVVAERLLKTVVLTVEQLVEALNSRWPGMGVQSDAQFTLPLDGKKGLVTVRWTNEVQRPSAVTPTDGL